jgi:hypothetical protein
MSAANEAVIEVAALDLQPQLGVSKGSAKFAEWDKTFFRGKPTHA